MSPEFDELARTATLTVTCPECGRVFNLLDEADGEEWAYGHDCEVVS